MKSNMKATFRTLSKRANDLLAKSEGFDVDWKRDEKVDPEDLVAFANSREGGTILLGVRETEGQNGKQVPDIAGCDISDRARLSIVNKARDCSPPIDIQIFVENEAKCPFLRVEIPSGQHKPYCTKAGRYLTRVDGRNSALMPQDLLALFVDVEGRKFIDHFQNATTEINTLMSGLKNTVEDGTLQLRKELDWANGQIEEGMRSLEADLGSAVDSIMTELNADLGYQIGELKEAQDVSDSEVRCLSAGVDALLRHAGLEDSYLQLWRPRIESHLRRVQDSHPDWSPLEVYEELTKLIRGCLAETIQMICHDILGKFKLPKRRRK
jgi:hypothetical protein